MTDPTYTVIGAAFIDEPTGRWGITLPTGSDVAFLVLSDDDWLRIGRAVALWFPPEPSTPTRAAVDAALAELRRARDDGEFNADEETILARMERLAASRPPRQDGAPGGEGP